MPDSTQKPPRPSRSPRVLLRTILMLDDTPHSIALGTAIGIFIGLTPTVGIQMALVLIFAYLMRPLFSFNKVAAVLLVYVSNPFTVVPIYWACYKLGTVFVEGSVTYAGFVKILEYSSFSEWWQTATSLVVDVGTPLLVGSLIVATVVAIPTYPIMLWLIGYVRSSETLDGHNTDDHATVPSAVSSTDDPAA